MPSRMSRKHKRKRSGHYCWACDCWRANERFSGRGHARHLCRDCARLGKDELEYRSALRNLQRCVTWDGIIRRKQRKQFEGFLDHPNARIRAAAQAVEQADLLAREFSRCLREADEEALERQDWSTEAGWGGVCRPRRAPSRVRRSSMRRTDSVPRPQSDSRSAFWPLLRLVNRETFQHPKRRQAAA
jgi:hypothetical protein